jgi:signal transduction histidine kinase/ActR/RegA family two-component response regulator
MAVHAGTGLDFLQGGGRMGALMRSHDWSRSPLGDPAQWPDTLKAAVATCLSSQFPMVVWWGQDLVMLYNDAWQPILGDTKHPSGLGRPGQDSWPETWPIVGRQFKDALGGVASWSEDLLLASDRHGYLEECYFTYSHSPLRDASGAVVGVHTVVSETTKQVLDARRLSLLRDLSNSTIEAVARAAPLDEVCASLTARLAARNPDVPFAVLYLTGPDRNMRRVATAGIVGERFPEMLGARDVDRWGLAEALRRRAPVVTKAAHSERLPGGVWPELTYQLVALPLSRWGPSEEPRGVLLIGANPRLRLDERYRDFLGLVAAQLAGAVSTVHGREQEKDAALQMDVLLVKERAARADAERAAKLKDEFLAILSHELRTPLSAVIGWTEILRQDLGDPERAAAAVEVIARNARHQAQLITDLLDVSRIVSGNMRVALEPLDIAGVIETAIASLTPDAEQKGVSIDRSLAPVNGTVRGDAHRLEQVFCNVLSNAVKFSARGGRVLVELADAGAEATIRIRDEGEGIAAEFLPHLFEPFRQEDATPSRKHGGLGLGLSIVKQLVELHGGKVGAVSDGPGRGTVVTIALPLSSAAGVIAIAPAIERERGGPLFRLRGFKVLVLDDEPDALAVIRRLLEDSDTDVSTASTSDEALELLVQRRFDAIVSDIAMPGRDGYAFITEVRARGIVTPAIALTAFARREDRAKAMSSGFQAHVTKPVDRGELLATLADFARGAPLAVPRRVESSEPLRGRRAGDQPL